MAKVQKDKKQHFGVCMTATLVAAVVNRLAGSSDNEAAVAGANLAIGLAAGKEYGDSKAIGNKWDWHDIAADAAGIFAGLAVYYAILYIYYILLRGE